jgi:hypothetical protein
MQDGEELLLEKEKTSHAARIVEASLNRADNVNGGAPSFPSSDREGWGFRPVFDFASPFCAIG